MLGPGTLIKNYEIQRKLGRGGMGTVFVAHDQVLGRMVAIKVFQNDLDVPDAADRFTREARSAAALQHANIVTIYEYFGHESQAYITMEYVQGETLAAVIHRREPIALAEKLRWLQELCNAVAYAHLFKVVHRDLKPANLMIDRTRRLKVLDFGIAKIMGTPSTTATGPVGTPGYMAPEQVSGGQVDHRADIFSIGVVAYELLSYTEAFPGENVHAIAERVRSQQPASLAALVPDAPPELVAAVERALAKSPADRFSDASELGAAIERVRRGVESEAVTNLPSRPAAAGQRPPTGSTRPGTGPGDAGSSPALSLPGRDPESLQARRTALVAAALERARAALHRGELEAARDECDQALLLDGTHAPALELDAAINAEVLSRRAASLRGEARQELARGSLTGAQQLVAQARELDPNAADLRVLERDLLLARVEQERIRHRAEAARLAIERAEDALRRRDLESALALARQALDFDPADPRARAAEAQALRALDEVAGTPTVFVPSAGDATVAVTTGSAVVDVPTVVLPAARPGAPAAPVSIPPPAPGPTSGTPSQVPVSPAVEGKSAPVSTSSPAVTKTRPPDGVVAALKKSADPAAAAWRTLTAPQKKIALGVAAAVLLLIVAGLAFVLRPTPALPTFVAVVDAVPFATVTRIQRADGTQVELQGEASTPLQITLPAGTYRVQLTGPAPENESREITVDVQADGTIVAPIEKFRVLTPAEYFEQYLSTAPDVPATEATPEGTPQAPAATPDGVPSPPAVPAPSAQGVSQ